MSRFLVAGRRFGVPVDFNQHEPAGVIGVLHDIEPGNARLTDAVRRIQQGRGAKCVLAPLLDVYMHMNDQTGHAETIRHQARAGQKENIRTGFPTYPLSLTRFPTYTAAFSSRTMATRIEIGPKNNVRDPRGRHAASAARTFLQLPVTDCRTRDVYKVDILLTRKDAEMIRKAFTDPVTSRSALGRLKAPADFDWIVEIGFKPGVTDNVGRTAQSIAADLLDRRLNPDECVYTCIQYFFKGENLTREQVETITWDVLANRLIQTAQIHTRDEWEDAPEDDSVPVFRDNEDVEVRTYHLGGRDEDLMRISREGILSLSLAEMHAIRDYFRRPDILERRASLKLPEDPTDVELECIAQTWSEHCKHKIFAADVRYRDGEGNEETIRSLYKTYIQAATRSVAEKVDWLVSVFTDNAGVIRFNDRYNLVYKVETHNSPSALDPYGGAMTGIVGVNRDPMGTGIGSELLFNSWGYCLGSPFFDGHLPEGLMHPRRIRDGVHQGVIDGGNQSGIPWVRGFEKFDDRFIGKPLVFCGTLGRMPREINGKPSHEKEIRPGDLIMMAGGRIGKDGIHGATFSSEELRQESPAQAVQIGDPITQRKLYEFLMEARDLGLYRTLTDNGAGGLSSSIGEMCRMSGGAVLDLDKAPLKYPGLQPWEIFLSEAQERMSIAVAPDKREAFLALAARRDVEACDIGTFTDSGNLVLRYGGKACGCIDLEFLHDGCPRMTIEAEWTPPSPPPPTPRPSGALTGDVLKLLASLDVCSREDKSRCYDAEVKGLSVVKPFVGRESDIPSDATVCRIDYTSDEGVVISEGINPYYSDLDTYWMTASVLDEAVRRIISAGGKPGTIAGLDNFCWPDPVASDKTPDGAYKMAQLVRSNKALYDFCTAYGVPLISGKDSMKNDSTRGGRKISIPPTLLFSAIGKIDDVAKAVTMPFKRAGDDILVIGETSAELGASAYVRMRAFDQGTPEAIGGDVPRVDAETALRIYTALYDAIQNGRIRSSHTPTLGGLAVGFTLAALGGNLGAEINLGAIPTRGRMKADEVLFAESNSRFIVTCDPGNTADVLARFDGLPIAVVGRVVEEPKLTVGSQAVRLRLDRARKAFRETLRSVS